MATQYINLKGKVAWAKVYEPDEYNNVKRWILNFYPFNEEEWKKFRDSGLQVEPKTDPQGNVFVRFRRDVRRVIGDDFIFFTPPVITGAVDVKYVDKATGQKVSSFKKGDGIEVEQVGEKVLIGNESVVYVNLAVYDTVKGKGHRLQSIHVLDLVGYDPDNKSEPEPEVEVETKAPVKEPKAKAVKKETEVKEEINDEIPW